MEQGTKGVRNFLRNSKWMFPLRWGYAQILDTMRFGVGYECGKCSNGIRRRIAKRKYHKKLLLSVSERLEQENQTYEKKITFSILVPLYNTPESFLREMIESVVNQTYKDWQLCLADGSDKDHGYVGEIVKEYKEQDSRISYQVLERNMGISENTNACIKMAQGEYIVLFDHDDLLHESALYELRQAIEKEQGDFIYTDEAVFSKDYHRPDSYHFKTDFALDDLRSNNYICHISCFSRELLDKVGYFRKEFDGSQDFDLILRLTEQAKKIVHIPKVLYFWRCHEASVASDISAKTYCIDAGRKAVEEHLQRQKIKAVVASSEVYPVIYRITYPVQETPLVSIIVWESKEQDAAHTQECIQSIKEHTGYTHYEILVAHGQQGRNEAAENAKGDYLVFMDNQCRCYQKDWLEEMLGVAQRKEVGGVGSRVDYTNGTIRDAGIILGVGKIGVNGMFRIKSDNMGFMGNMYYAHNVSALSDSCLMVSKDKFMAVKGFCQELPGWYAGIDLSLKLRKAGFWNVLNPYAKMLYGQKEKKRDFNGVYHKTEQWDRIFLQHWDKKEWCNDPFYNRNLTKKTKDYSVG